MATAWINEMTLISFDGSVLEVFGGSDASKRYHVENLQIRIKDPDRKGRRMIEIATRIGRQAQVMGLVDSEHWPAVEPVLAAATAESTAPN